MPASSLPIAILHLDESCLGNGREGDNPGGAGGLIEVRTKRGIRRQDFFIHAPATTNNRMALSGAIAGLQLVAGKGARLNLLVVSDSQYLITGIREWVPAWIARNWRRKGGAIENLALWQTLVTSAKKHEVQWTWVRGHSLHAKNEYANDLAVGAAVRQETSPGLIPSGFGDWLAQKGRWGQYLDYDPDRAFAVLEKKIEGGDRFAIIETS